MSRLYYEAPSDAEFQDMKAAAEKVWEKYKDSPGGYYEEKVARVKDVLNVKDNFMYIFAMFDQYNQAECVSLLASDTRKALKARMIDGGNPPSYLRLIGLL